MKKILLVLLIGVFASFTSFSQVQKKSDVQHHVYLSENSVNKKIPSFRGGDIEDFRVYIQKNVKYPEEAIKDGVSGTVYVKFNITRRGKIVRVEIIRSVKPCLDKAVVDAIKHSPDWDHRRGKTFSFTIPVNFILK